MSHLFLEVLRWALGKGSVTWVLVWSV